MKKRIVSLVLALVLVLGLLPGSVMAQWPSFRGNGSNMGITDVQTPAPDYAKLQWAAKWATPGFASRKSPSLPGMRAWLGFFANRRRGGRLIRSRRWTEAWPCSR